jgi:hypothetical protein
MAKDTQLAVKIILDAWYSRVESVERLLTELTDEQLLNEIAPKRNRGIYILGHLTAVQDNIIPLLGAGQRLYPQLDDVFLAKPDKAVSELPSVSDLRNYWKNVNTKLTAHFSKLGTEEWFQKHNSISNEDFIEEPHRNRLNVISSRTNHLAYHHGQLVILKAK